MAEQKTSKQVSLEQEEKLAKFFGGSRTPRSGGGGFVKGDVLSDNWFIEGKTNVKPAESYSVRKEILEKMDHERAEMRKPYAALAIELGESRDDYFVINRRTMKGILDTQDGVKALIASLHKQLAELDERYQKMRYGDDGVSPQDTALYNAHKAEKLATIEELEKLV